MKLDQLKIIITGAGRGMGAHFATQLAEAGAKVAAGDVDVDGLEALPGNIAKRRLDVTNEAECDAFVAWAQEELGGVNGLVNNAGIIRDALLAKRSRSTGELQSLSTEHWNAVLAVNLTGAMFMTRAFALNALQHEVGPGVVVNISSISRHGSRGQSNYVATKAALAANTVTWAREFARMNIRVGAVAPGMIETPMTQGMNQKARDALVAGIPVGRIGTPQDIWHAVRFVLECDYFNARTIDVDGGASMG
ncbi:MAG: SDR family oxidoreductase [Myxococcota bacterium]